MTGDMAASAITLGFDASRHGSLFLRDDWWTTQLRPETDVMEVFHYGRSLFYMGNEWDINGIINGI